MDTPPNTLGVDTQDTAPKRPMRKMMTSLRQPSAPEVPFAATLFYALDMDAKGYVVKRDILEGLTRTGISLEDERLKQAMLLLRAYEDSQPISLAEFEQVIRSNSTLFDRVYKGHLAIPDFEEFCDDLTDLYHRAANAKAGKVADYIPQLQLVDPEKFCVSVCTVDGQRFSIGDMDDHFVVQSICKTINYCIGLEEHGEDFFHSYVGREPSGHGFNELKLNAKGLPHNPMINAGAILGCALIKPKMTVAERFDEVMKVWQDLSGGGKPGFNNSVYLSERKTADRNYALGYFMRENKAFPPDVDLIETLEFYFQCCSIEMTAPAMSVVAATMANAGVCPITEKKVFEPNTVKHCLSLMYSCGMYDFSGEFSFTVGLPAKSGVSGALIVVVPNVAGFCIWSPRLDALGNSVRGLAFCEALVQKFNFHNYDSLLQNTHKKDPRLKKNKLQQETVMTLSWAASKGDLNEMKRVIANGVNVNAINYDGRTALHVAVSNGQLDAARYLLMHQAKTEMKDRWGHTPLDEAHALHEPRIIALLEAHDGR